LKVFINNLKDGFLEKALRVALNLFIKYKLSNVGKVCSLQINSSSQFLQIAVELKGELAPFDLIAQYEILNPTQIRIASIQCSREWVVILFNEKLPEESKKLTLPHLVVSGISKVIK